MNWLWSLDTETGGTQITAHRSADKTAKTQRVKTGCFKFSYCFATGQLLSGRVAGDVIVSRPNLVFNLHGLNAVLQDQSLQTVLRFDTIFGQFKLDQPEVLLSGSDSESGSFFCFNYRASEAIVFDGRQKSWIASGWMPEAWHAEALLRQENSTPHSIKRPIQISGRTRLPAAQILH
ncbi:MAG TPA: hypothetical protein V6D29_24190 [Leptolyngbyaceae cyanobacterium]